MKIFWTVCLWSIVFCAKAQISLSSTTTLSTCSANGSISIQVTGGTLPYIYQIVSSTTGIVRPAQNVNTFQNLPPGTYTIRVSDGNSTTAQIQVVLNGNYTPLRFTTSQTQSTITVTPLNGKSPYLYTYSIDGGTNFLPYTNNNIFTCLTSGVYTFRIKDSCDNIYTETIFVNAAPIQAHFNCTSGSGIRNISLQSVNGGNGGYSYTLLSTGISEINMDGNFTVTNSCLRNMKIKISDQCNFSTEETVCQVTPYQFSLGCVNFNTHTIQIDNVTGGDGSYYQYIANDVSSPNSTVSNFPITADSILFGLVDSCRNKNLMQINKMAFVINQTSECEQGTVQLQAAYEYNGIQAFNIYPVRYFTLSGPSNFNVTAFHDTDLIFIKNLPDGNYSVIAQNACGDTAMTHFTISRICYRNISITKTQYCDNTIFTVFKDCGRDTNVVYKLYNMQNVLLQTNYTGNFATNNDSCYKVTMYDTVCDTMMTDYINPFKMKSNYIQNACNRLNIGVSYSIKQVCHSASTFFVRGHLTFTFTDSLFIPLRTTDSNSVANIPIATKYIITKLDDCMADTLVYTKFLGFIDTVKLCLKPTVKVVNNKCLFAWQVELLNNPLNRYYTLSGTNTSIQSNHYFLSVDTGQFYLNDGCNNQPLYLPNLFNYTLEATASCPGNSVVKAGNWVDTNYIDSVARTNYFSICQNTIIDYTIQEVGNPSSVQYNPLGYFTNLKNGTYYAVFYKGNASCNYFSDTIFTPFYTRPALTATYGLICNGNNATIKVSVTDGRPPYTFEVVNSSILPIVTDSTSVYYTTLPLGTSQFKVTDACGVSMDFATEVLSVDFVPTYKKQCDGRVELIAPDIFNTSYVWLNNQGDTLGTQPIVYTVPNGADTFHLVVHHFNCTINKTIYVDDFTASLINANAGPDKIVDTAYAQLDGNTIPSAAIGTWTQINPSSGISTFQDNHNPNSGVTVDVFPGRYTYVWTVSDTANGCVSMDTVEINYLKCPGITDIFYTKTKTNGVCVNNGSIAIQITQSSLPVKYLWNTGDTSRVLSNLDSGMYIVKIYDNSSCTQDIYDTTFITKTMPSTAILNTHLCHGDTLIIHQKKYFAQGTYFDTLMNTSGCDSILTLTITAFPKFAFYDTISICAGQSYTLPNGQILTQNGTYAIHYNSSSACDSAYFYTLNVIPNSRTQIDSTLCSYQTFVLSSGQAIQQSGIYFDTLTNSLHCDSILQYTLTFLPKLSKPFLGLDTTICIDDPLELELNYPAYVYYIWQDSSTNAHFTVSEQGIYWVRITDACTIEKDTIQIKTKTCDCHFYIPTAFSPNNDGYNDNFMPINKCEFFSDYHFSIFNRWGELVFESKQANSSWDGKNKGAEQPLDDYIWIFDYTEKRTGDKKTYKGIVTLLR